MTATPYRAINWNPNDLIGEDKMDQLVNNTQWLYENTPRAVYTTGAIRRESGVRFACGRVIIAPRKSPTASVSINFANMFTPPCEPVITTSITTTGQRRVFHVINGLGDLVSPDHRGFVAYVEVDGVNKASDRIATAIYVNWQAMGY